MATKEKKGKGKGIGEKGSAKRSEETTPCEEKRDETPKSGVDGETPAEEPQENESVPPPEETPAQRREYLLHPQDSKRC